MSRVSRVTAAICAAALAGGVTVATVPTASSASAAQTSSSHARARVTTTFTVSSFNVLGASHTKHSKKWASGGTRIVRVNKLLDRHHVDVAGFQEMQPSQLTKFLTITEGGWAVYPGTTLSKWDSDNSIGWRTDKFELVQGTTIKIPYFNGTKRAMPLVLLRNRQTGMLVYVANYHNPAETKQYRHQGKWRAEATRIEIALQNLLYSRGIPRLVTGDMNERAPYFCRVAKEAPLKAARPNTYIGQDGVCHANRPRAVDWILGGPRLAFSNYSEDRTHLVDITTDHPVISSDVTVDPAKFPRAWHKRLPAPIDPNITF